MIFIVLKKELLDNLLNQRFVVCTAVAVILILGTGLVNSRNFVQKMANYHQQIANYEAALREVTFYLGLTRDNDNPGQYRAQIPKAFRRPQLLELFAQGQEKQLGQVVSVSPFKVPYKADKADPFNSNNPYLSIFLSYDTVFVFQLVLGLLAILMGSEAISKEKEDGTLQLILTTHVSRAQVLAGKLLGGGVILAIPTALSFIILLILLIGTEGIQLHAEDWLRLGILLSLSFLYLTLFYLIGLVISCATERSSTSVISGLFVWAFMVVVSPTGITSLLNEIAHQGSNKLIVEEQYRQLKREFHRAADDIVHGNRYPPMDMVEIMPSASMVRYTASDGGEMGDFIYTNGELVDSPTLSQFLDIQRSGERLRLQFAQRVWNARKPLLEDHPRRLVRLYSFLQRLSPAGAYAEVSAIIARTDHEGFYSFLEQTRDYRQQIVSFLEDRDAFGLRTWFNDGTEQANLHDMPRFMEQKETPIESLGRALPGLSVLFFYTYGSFSVCVWLFGRYEVI